MGILQVNHIRAACEKRFSSIVDLNDLSPNASPEDKENNFLTRALAAFAIAELSKSDDKIAADAVVDEGGDDGIDAFYFDRTEHICYLVQSKWRKNGTGSIEVGDVLKFIQGVNHLLEANLDALGPKLQGKRPDISDVLADSRARFVLCIAYTGQQSLSAEAMVPLNQLLSELNDDEELVSLRTLKQKDLHGIVAQQALGESVDFDIMLHEWGSVKEPYRAYYGQVAVADILSWAKYGDHLYHRNIRGFKGSTDVNTAIVETVKNSPDNFWYFNNGITILCSQLTKQPLGGKSRDSGVFECKGASVVNGAQTVGSIMTALSNAATPSPSRVLVRLISLENCPPDFAADLTRAANTQNRIEKRDFAALDKEQARLRTDLLLSFSKEYVYKTGDLPPQPDNGCTLDEATVALACVQADITYSIQAKREIGKLYDDIQQPPYTVLFNGSVTAQKLWRAVQVLRSVDSQLKTFQDTYEGKDRLIAIHGNRFVLHLIFQDIGANSLDDSAVKLDDILKKIKAEPVLKKVIAGVEALYKTAYPSNLFKNVSKCKELAEWVEEH